MSERSLLSILRKKFPLRPDVLNFIMPFFNNVITFLLFAKVP